MRLEPGVNGLNAQARFISLYIMIKKFNLPFSRMLKLFVPDLDHGISFHVRFVCYYI